MDRGANPYPFTRKDFGYTWSCWDKWADGRLAHFIGRTLKSGNPKERTPHTVTRYTIEHNTVEMSISTDAWDVDIAQYLSVFFEHAGIKTPFKIVSIIPKREGVIDMNYSIVIEWDGDATPQNLNEYLYAGEIVEGWQPTR